MFGLCTYPWRTIDLCLQVTSPLTSMLFDAVPRFKTQVHSSLQILFINMIKKPLTAFVLFSGCQVMNLSPLETREFLDRQRFWCPGIFLPGCGRMMSAFVSGGGSVGGPLILTPYLDSGQVSQARALSLVKYFQVESHAGFFTTNLRYNSNIFFWFFPPIVNPEKAPLLVWLNGGPGSSSLFGLFVENGPFLVDEEKVVGVRKKSSWSLTNNVLYIDSPVGTGFSFTKNESGYARNMEEITDGLESTLCQFFILFPELIPRDLYLTGESYAGKYIPNLAYRILENNNKLSDNSSPRMNLKGISIGNGFIDPLHSLNYSIFLFNLGLFDKKTMKIGQEWEKRISGLILQEKWLQAFQEYDDFIGYSGKRDNFITEKTGLEFYYNILVSKRPKDYDYFTRFVDQPEIRELLKVGDTPFDTGDHVMTLLRPEIMKSEKHVLEFLLNNGLRILLYNGQLDMIVPNRLTDDLVDTLKWIGRKAFLNSTRHIWRVHNGQVGGYYKSHLNFTRLTIRNCGHMVPYDKPKWAFQMITDFTSGKF